MTNIETRLTHAEGTLYAHACSTLGNAEVHLALEQLGLSVDLRTWEGNTIDVCDLRTGQHHNCKV